MPRTKRPNTSPSDPTRPCPDCGCRLDMHSGDEVGGPAIPYCIECGRPCRAAKGTAFARAFSRWRDWEMEVVEVELDPFDILMVLDAFDCWQAHGCPTRNPALQSNPPAEKQIEDLKQRLWAADEVIVRLQRGESQRVREDGAH